MSVEYAAVILSKFKRMGGLVKIVEAKALRTVVESCLRELLSAVAELKSTAKTIFASYAVAQPLCKSGCRDTD